MLKNHSHTKGTSDKRRRRQQKEEKKGKEGSRAEVGHSGGIRK